MYDLKLLSAIYSFVLLLARVLDIFYDVKRLTLIELSRGVSARLMLEAVSLHIMCV